MTHSSSLGEISALWQLKQNKKNYIHTYVSTLDMILVLPMDAVVQIVTGSQAQSRQTHPFTKHWKYAKTNYQLFSMPVATIFPDNNIVHHSR